MKKLPSQQLPSEWESISWVLTDVDDTLTWQGKLPPETLIALNQLQQNGIKVIAVTGACAGWCDHIAQLWPVDAVIGENGAFVLEKENGFLALKADFSREVLKQQQIKLETQVLDILKAYPNLNLTLDQSYRLCEVAIDIGQNRPKVDSITVGTVVEKIQALGAHATASSIHINAWYGNHSKITTSLHFLKAKGLSDSDIQEQCCYVGDSLNDEQMFATLSKSVGVANLTRYWEQLTAFPTVITQNSGGYGFAEFTDNLLQLKGKG
ncbi:HAD family hydrolase [Vibrio sp. WJH972]